jgi:surface antigen
MPVGHAARVVIALGFAASLAACANSPENMGSKEASGTLLGAGAGALLGAAVTGGNTTSKLGGAAAGALLGGLIGNRIGAGMDEEDKRRAYEAQMAALERGPSGAPVAWRNPDSGRYGSIVPGPAYQANGRNCRSYTHTIYIDGTPQTARGTACRNPDGTWTPLA